MMAARILFSTNQLPGSMLIRVGTWSRFSHCDLVTAKGTLIGATASAGVHEYALADRLAASTRWALYEVDANLEKVEAAARHELGGAYDWLACAGVAFHRDWRTAARWMCSELLAWAFEKGDRPLVNPSLRINRVTPETLLRSPVLSLVQESP